MRNKSLVCFLAVTVALFALLAFWPSHTKAQSVTVTLAPYVACGSVTSSTVGGKIGTYVSGTSTPQATYQDPAGQFPNQNPISLNGNSAQIWLQTGLVYRFVVMDSNSVTQCTIDSLVGVGGGSSGGASSNWSSLLPGTNTNSGTFIASGNGWDFSAANLFKAPVASGISLTAVGSFGYDSSASKWQFFQNGSQIGFGVAPSTACSGSQVPLNFAKTAAAACTQLAASNLSNGTTGSGSVVLSASPSITGTVGGGATYSSPVDTSPTFNSHVLSGSAFQTATSGSVSMGANAETSVTVNWSVAFADTGYYAFCSLSGMSASLADVLFGGVVSQTTSSVTVSVYNNNGVSLTRTVNCMGVHP